jgi:hypothetical protein
MTGKPCTQDHVTFVLFNSFTCIDNKHIQAVWCSNGATVRIAISNSAQFYQPQFTTGVVLKQRPYNKKFQIICIGLIVKLPSSMFSKHSVCCFSPLESVWVVTEYLWSPICLVTVVFSFPSLSLTVR